jgi:hypothetical protein
MNHKIPNEFGIAAIAFLPPARAAPNLGGMAKPNFTPKFRQHRFEPGTIATGFESDDHVTGELLVESANLFFVLVL